jgi:hypothetical protein
MEKQELLDYLARAKWEYRRQTPWGRYSSLPPWEKESETLRDEIRGEVRAVLDALTEAGYSLTPKEPG